MNEALYFHRQIQLWGETKQEALKQKRIAIIGSGGLGSTLAMALGTSGIGEITLVDFDEVSAHNIHRQILFTLADEGRAKAKVATEVIASKNPFVKSHAHIMPFEEFTKEAQRYDLILDATDNLETRYEIDRFAKSNATPWIHASVEEFHGRAAFIDKADFGVFPLSDHKPGGIAAPIVMFIGSLQANLALRYLLGLEVVKDRLYYLFFDDRGDLKMQTFNLPKAKE